MADKKKYKHQENYEQKMIKQGFIKMKLWIPDSMKDRAKAYAQSLRQLYLGDKTEDNKESTKKDK